MKLFILTISLLAASAAYGQTWTIIPCSNMTPCSGSTQPHASGVPSVSGGHYAPSNGLPTMRSQAQSLYDSLDQKIMFMISDAGSLNTEWGNSEFNYDPATNTWVPVFYSLIASTSDQSTISTMSRTGCPGSCLTTVTVPNNNTNYRSFIVGASFAIAGATTDTTFNGIYVITSATGCDSTGTLCTGFTSTTNPQSGGNSSPSASGTVAGPLDSSNVLVTRHNQGWVYDTTRNAIWNAFGVGDNVTNSTLFFGTHSAVMDLYKMTFNTAVASQWSWSEICGYGVANCSTANGTSPCTTGTIDCGVPCPSTSNTSTCSYKFNYGGYDATNDVYVIFGGTKSGGTNSPGEGETIYYHPSTNTWQNICGTAGLSSCGPTPRASVTDGRLVSIGGGKLFLFGGQSQSTTPCGSGLSAALSDTWILTVSTGVWTQEATSQTPGSTSPACDVNPLYDYISGVGVVLIDKNASGSHTWYFNTTTNLWTDAGIVNGPVLQPPAGGVQLQTGVYDPHTKQFLVFAMYTSAAVSPPCTTTPTTCNVVYALTFPNTPTILAQEPIGVQAETWPGGCHTNCVSLEPAASTRPSNASVTFGAVIPDSWAVAGPSGTPLGYTWSQTQLAVINASTQAIQNGQFRCMTVYSDGNCEWVIVDLQDPSFTEGSLDSTYSLALLSSGGGNNPATTMGSSSSGVYTINTTAATFTIDAANNDLFHDVLIGSTHVVLSSSHGANDGLLLNGPSHTQYALGTIDSVSCNPGPPPTNYAGATVCATPYLANADASATCSFQDNGPLRTVLMCQGDFKNSSSDVYMHWRRYYTFWFNHTDVQVSTALRNADSSTTGSDFASAYKEFGNLDARITPNLASGSRTIIFGNPTSTTTTTLTSTTSTDNAYLYLGFEKKNLWSDFQEANCGTSYDDCVVSPILRTGSANNWTYPQDGWQINSTKSITGTSSGTSAAASCPPGWAIETDSSGNGVEIGINQYCGKWPNMLGFFNGGNEVRIGILPDQTLYLPNPTSIQTYAQPWPQYYIMDLWFNFFTTAPSSASDAFIDWQQNLWGRTPFKYYNSSFAIPMVDPVAEDQFNLNFPAQPLFVTGCGAAGSCLADVGGTGSGQTNNVTTTMYNFLFYSWANGGPNQMDDAGSLFHQSLQRGCTPVSGLCSTMATTGSQPGKLQWAKNFYRDQVARGCVPRSDFGGWRTVSSPIPNVLSAWGYPDRFTSWNEGMRQFCDDKNGQDHFHLEWLTEYESYSADPWLYEQLDSQGFADSALNTNIGFYNPANLASGQNPGRLPCAAIRACGHALAVNSQELEFLCDVRDPSVFSSSICQTSALAGIETMAGYMEAPAVANGYPTTITEPTEATCKASFTSLCTGGQNPVRGYIAVGANTNGSTDNCAGSTAPCDGAAHHAIKPFQVQAAEEGLYLFNLTERSFRGSLWTASSVTVANDGNATNVVVPLSDAIIQQAQYGAGNWFLNENYINNGTVTLSGPIYETYLSFLNPTPPCTNTSAPNCSRLCPSIGDCQFGGENYLHWGSVAVETNSDVDLNSSSILTPWQLYIGKMGSGAIDEWESPEMQLFESYAINAINSPPTLLDLHISVTPSTCPGGGSGSTCTISWTPPTGLTSVNGTTYRLVYYSYATSGGTQKAIKNWLLFYPNCTISPSYSEGTCPATPAGLQATDASGFWPTGQTPDVDTQWFSSSPVTDPTLQTSTGSYTFTAAANTSYVFDLKAYATGIPVTPGTSTANGTKISNGVKIQ